MTNDDPRRSPSTVSRRAALTGLGGGGAGLVLAAARPAAAQDATPVATAGHPVVGTWLLADPADPSQPGVLNTFFADGNVVVVRADGAPSLGVWEATGPRTGAVTSVGFHRGTGWSAVGLERLRAVLEVDAADVLHGDGVVEVVGFDGTVLESFPAPAVGARIAVVPLEATGTPAP